MRLVVPSSHHGVLSRTHQADHSNCHRTWISYIPHRRNVVMSVTTQKTPCPSQQEQNNEGYDIFSKPQRTDRGHQPKRTQRSFQGPAPESNTNRFTIADVRSYSFPTTVLSEKARTNLKVNGTKWGSRSQHRCFVVMCVVTWPPPSLRFSLNSDARRGHVYTAAIIPRVPRMTHPHDAMWDRPMQAVTPVARRYKM